MKATGIVRRIDDLGRVVVPKEIRRTLRIREGDPLEIFTDREGEIILKKYSPIGELGTFAKLYAESLAQTLGVLVCVTDKDQVVAAAGNGKKEFHDRHIHKYLTKVIEDREQILAKSGEKKYIPIVTDQEEKYAFQIICPIISEGDAIGSVVILEKSEKKELEEIERKVAMVAAEFLGRQMEQ